MQMYTSQGFEHILYKNRTEIILKSRELSVQSSIRTPFSFTADEESERNLALLQKNILEAAACDASVLEAREKAIDVQKVERCIQEAARAWAEAAGEFELLRMAKDLQAAAVKPVSTNGVWIDEPLQEPYECLKKTISNNCFAATVSVVRRKKFDSQVGALAWSNVWYTRWTLSTNYNTIHEIIKDVDRKFTDLEEAKRYLQKQMNDLNKKYFYAMDPVITKDMREHFLVHDMEIPGKNYEKA